MVILDHAAVACWSREAREERPQAGAAEVVLRQQSKTLVYDLQQHKLYAATGSSGSQAAERKIHIFPPGPAPLVRELLQSLISRIDPAPAPESPPMLRYLTGFVSLGLVALTLPLSQSEGLLQP